jgi:hypothetical protein
VGNGNTFTYAPLNGDIISAKMTSNAHCATGSPATSTNSVTMTVNPIVQAMVSLDVSRNPVNSGNSVTFEVHAQNEGISPVYRWFVNNLIVPNAERNYTFEPNDKDEVYVEMTSNASPCLAGSPVISNTIKMSVSINTSTEQNENSKIRIYSTDKNIFVNCMEEAKQILIYNELGSLIQFDNDVNGLKKFDMRNVQSEYYIVKVITQYNVYSVTVFLK